MSILHALAALGRVLAAVAGAALLAGVVAVTTPAGLADIRQIVAGVCISATVITATWVIRHISRTPAITRASQLDSQTVYARITDVRRPAKSLAGRGPLHHYTDAELAAELMARAGRA
jgi:hypothetical protein